MFDAIAKLFRPGADAPAQSLDPKTAVAALLVHLAAVDGQAQPEELRAVSGILMDHYGLSESEVRRLVEDARQRDREAVDFYQFTATLTKLDEAEKIAIIRMMWQVVFVDEANHELEDNMVWRVAELIGVSTRDRTVLRNQMKRGVSGGGESEA